MKPGKRREVIEKRESQERNFPGFLASCLKSCRVGLGRCPVGLLLVLAAPVFGAPSAPPPEYSRDVRPILSDNCFKCHGPDEGARKGRLRLDLPDSALQGGKSGL